jgi:hypothetical protein
MSIRNNIRLGSEYKITKEPFNILVGTIDREKPSSVYLNISTWTTKVKDIDIIDNVKYKLSNTVKRELYKLDLNLNKDRTIVDIKYAETLTGTKTFLKVELNLYLKDMDDAEFYQLKSYLNSISDIIINILNTNCEYWNFSLSRKDILQSIDF